jgi:hypothetical protein
MMSANCRPLIGLLLGCSWVRPRAMRNRSSRTNTAGPSTPPSALTGLAHRHARTGELCPMEKPPPVRDHCALIRKRALWPPIADSHLSSFWPSCRMGGSRVELSGPDEWIGRLLVQQIHLVRTRTDGFGNNPVFCSLHKPEARPRKTCFDFTPQCFAKNIISMARDNHRV